LWEQSSYWDITIGFSLRTGGERDQLCQFMKPVVIPNITVGFYENPTVIAPWHCFLFFKSRATASYRIRTEGALFTVVGFNCWAMKVITSKKVFPFFVCLVLVNTVNLL
jgi:hypothetical protein